MRYKVAGLCLILLPVITVAEPVCTYSTYTWNTQLHRPVDHQIVEKPYSELSEMEIDEVTGCSVCEQDQVEVHIRHLKSFKVCYVFAGWLEKLLNELVEDGEPLEKVIGYRVGKTRGDADEYGNRTRFSNHSFGIAVDINPEHNGLYDQCVEYGNACRLIKGGPWSPGLDKRSLTSDSRIVELLEQAGFKWGGEIAGKQKDFMHFSPTGY